LFGANIHPPQPGCHHWSSSREIIISINVEIGSKAAVKNKMSAPPETDKVEQKKLKNDISSVDGAAAATCTKRARSTCCDAAAGGAGGSEGVVLSSLTNGANAAPTTSTFSLISSSKHSSAKGPDAKLLALMAPRYKKVKRIGEKDNTTSSDASQTAACSKKSIFDWSLAFEFDNDKDKIAHTCVKCGANYNSYESACDDGGFCSTCHEYTCEKCGTFEITNGWKRCPSCQRKFDKTTDTVAKNDGTDLFCSKGCGQVVKFNIICSICSVNLGCDYCSMDDVIRCDNMDCREYICTKCPECPNLCTGCDRFLCSECGNVKRGPGGSELCLECMPSSWQKDVPKSLFCSVCDKRKPKLHSCKGCEFRMCEDCRDNAPWPMPKSCQRDGCDVFYCNRCDKDDYWCMPCLDVFGGGNIVCVKHCTGFHEED